MHIERFYRTWVSGGDLLRFRVVRHESDMEITAGSDLSMEACDALFRVRRDIEEYASEHPEFLESMVPLGPGPDAPGVVRRMCEAASEWSVGPMAAVAGSIAEAVGERLSPLSKTVVVENGGDIYIRSDSEVSCALYAGEDSAFSGRIGFSVRAPKGAGICTSSGTLGHSVSFGRADAVTVVARGCALADAAATSIANRISSEGDVPSRLEELKGHPGIHGAVACFGGMLASYGIRLMPVGTGEDCG